MVGGGVVGFLWRLVLVFVLCFLKMVMGVVGLEVGVFVDGFGFVMIFFWVGLEGRKGW